MKTVSQSLLVLLGAALATGPLLSQIAKPAASHEVTPAQYEEWKKELSNWGRWGKDDEIGALHLITPAKRKQAASLVKEGVSVSMSADADTVKAVDNANPYEFQMTGIGADRIGVAYHGIAHT